MNAAQQGVSVTVALICLTGAFLLWKVGHQHWPRITLLLIATAGAGLMPTKVGDWARSAMAWTVQFIGDLLSNFVGTGQVNGTVIGALIAIGILATVAFHVFKHKSITGGTLGAAAAVPLTVGAIPGAVGTAAVTIVGAVVGGVAQLILSVFSLG